LSPRRLDRFAGVDVRLECRQRQVDLDQNPRNVADLNDRATKRVLHVLQAECERPVERPDELRFDAIIARCRAPRATVAVAHLFRLLSPER